MLTKLISAGFAVAAVTCFNAGVPIAIVAILAVNAVLFLVAK